MDQLYLEEVKVLGQALLAMALGGVLGWEREVAGKGAGFRTQMLVCVAAMIFVKVGQFMIQDLAGAVQTDVLRADPVRIIEAIVTGVAFIGAGSVFRDPDRNIAQGLTTAATLLVVAPIGIAVAIERYVLAVGLTILVLMVLRLFQSLERRMGGSLKGKGGGEGT